MTMPDPFKVPQRTTHIVCVNRRTAPQVYVIGQNANGEGGRRYRAKDGDHLYIGEPDARELCKKGYFQFVAFEEEPKNQNGQMSLKPAKTIEEIYAEQHGANIQEKVAAANQPVDVTKPFFVPTTEPSLQPQQNQLPNQATPTVEQMRPQSFNIPVPSTEEFNQNLGAKQLQPQQLQQFTEPDPNESEIDRVARVAERMRRLRGNR